MKFTNIDLELLKRLYEKTITIMKKETANIYVLDTIVAAAIVFIMLMVICRLLGRMQKKPLPLNSRIGYALSGAYSIFMFEMTIFSREADSRDGIFNNSIFASSLTETERIFIFLNIIFFVPFGIALAEGLYHQFKLVKSMLLVTLASLIFTVFIESVQRLTGRGYFEVADIEANTLGGVIGGLIGVAIGAAFYNKYRKKPKTKHKKRIKNETSSNNRD